MRRRYLIATTPRSGSGFLCELLNRSEAAGMQPRNEKAGWEYLKPRISASNLSATDLLEESFRRSEVGGVEGFKVMWLQLKALFAHCEGTGERAALREHLASLPWIRLRRLDQVAQAVSWAKAEQTMQWNSTKRPKSDWTQYNHALIALRLAHARRSERSWDRWFSDIAVEPLELVYEDYVADLPGTMLKISQHLQCDPPLVCREENTLYEVQRDGTNQVWKDRFLRERRSYLGCGAGLLRSGFSRSTWRALSWRAQLLLND